MSLAPGRCRSGDRFLVHLGSAGLSSCGRTLRHAEAPGTPPTCQRCLHIAERTTGVVYLLHFDRPFGHARHYMGWSQRLAVRLMYHRHGEGANLLRHVRKAGIDWTVVGVWPGDRRLERAMKNHGHARRCPRC